MSSSKRKSESCINNLAFDVNSDSETDMSTFYSDEFANLSSDEFSSDSDVSDSESVDVAGARVWCRVYSASPPAPPSRFPITGNPGLQVPLADKSDPLAYLRLFLDDELIDHIVVRTGTLNRRSPELLNDVCLVRVSGNQSIKTTCGCLLASWCSRHWFTSHNSVGTGQTIACWRPRYFVE